VGAVFVDHERVTELASRLHDDARVASSGSTVAPVSDLGDHGGAAASIAALSRAVDELGDAIGLHLGFTAAAVTSVATQAAVADGLAPS
jgi:hypothetical protein